jgi:inosose dehydratase
MHRIGTLATSPDAFSVWEPDHPANPSWQSFLDAAQATGYDAVELGPYGYLPTTASELQDALAFRNLGMAGGYAIGDFATTDGLAAVIDLVRQVASLTAAAGANVIVLLATAASPTKRRLQLEGHQWASVVSGLMTAAKVAAEEYGLEAAYHPHRDLAVETESETARLVSDTHGQLALCLDVGQLQSTGANPVQMLRDFGPLVKHLHIRDINKAVADDGERKQTNFFDLVHQGLFCDPGTGAVRLDQVAMAASDIGYDGAVVVERSPLELDFGEAFRIAADSSVYLRRLGFG